MNWSHFQIVMLAFAGSLLIIRVLILRFRARVKVFRIGHPSEAGFVLGEALVILLILRHEGFVVVPLPEILDTVVAASGLSRWLGALLIAAGVTIFAAALLSLGDSWRIGIDRQTPGALVTSGIFRLSRNPIFVFLNFYLAGTFLINGTLVFLVTALVGAAFLHLQILREEQFLRERYGETYQKYCVRTPRYFFFS
jgi:protein-S-isoprenylcysteine O-methyltransferase Ste14